MGNAPVGYDTWKNETWTDDRPLAASSISFSWIFFTIASLHILYQCFGNSNAYHRREKCVWAAQTAASIIAISLFSAYLARSDNTKYVPIDCGGIELVPCNMTPRVVLSSAFMFAAFILFCMSVCIRCAHEADYDENRDGCIPCWGNEYEKVKSDVDLKSNHDVYFTYTSSNGKLKKFRLRKSEVKRGPIHVASMIAKELRLTSKDVICFYDENDELVNHLNGKKSFKIKVFQSMNQNYYDVAHYDDAGKLIQFRIMNTFRNDDA